ncbi:MAG: outer membrane lipoprotein carrier protein LolA [Alteromonadaceae bacterium]|jgi:outer membrane lipoprotein carrier protein|uniref:outer membrane lipoprotein chaperone LolA n=1 Tax=Rheinheimera aquimaris TaxID=412437 RepID=UPI000C495C7E|nr:outer membrane lipoprotein chaperone LolA [Rheinheimera aquimaris]MBJ92617.1 outer membrane lipoprotein carrier protein LolA [Alteromonadaceae bacterium]HBN90128.1 outer membrane lipoprotein carrier protein LolA [Rheinheimera sp.]|tara:strand:- start:6581 stop:7192 length:612 start_codon:yes stop_codon:yes gene_type:complete
MLSKVFAVVLMSVSVSALAQSAEEQLQRKLATIKTFSASFEQQVTDAQHQLLQQGKGQLMIKQPARFRFETTEPEPNLFIGDGATLWFYNEPLEQLTIYDAQNEVNRTPFVLLTSTKPELWQQYDVTRQGEQFVIRSKAADSPVKQLTLSFSGSALSKMQVLDMNQQLSEFNFTLVQLNIALEDSLFRFEPPEHTDIDDQRQR